MNLYRNRPAHCKGHCLLPPLRLLFLTLRRYWGLSDLHCVVATSRHLPRTASCYLLTHLYSSTRHSEWPGMGGMTLSGWPGEAKNYFPTMTPAGHCGAPLLPPPLSRQTRKWDPFSLSKKSLQGQQLHSAFVFSCYFPFPFPLFAFHTPDN